LFAIADDINFAVRGFNPDSCVAMANKLLAIVADWSRRTGIPMAKLQASWLTGSDNTQWAESYNNGVLKCGDGPAITPGTAPVKLLGVMFDTAMNGTAHVDMLVAACKPILHMLSGMQSSVKADQMRIMYRSLVLSRITYACDAWYPFITEANRERLRDLHYRGCRLITGCVPTSHEASVIYEAGFRSLDDEVGDIVVALADKLRRMSDGCASADAPETCFGPQWCVCSTTARCRRRRCARFAAATAPSASARRPSSRRPASCGPATRRCRCA
jgi:hypothetical protein